MRNTYKACMVALSVLLTPLAAVAQTPEEKGLEIAIAADKKGDGFQDMQAKMLMVLKNKQGKSSERELRVMSLEVPEDGDKSLTIFDTPRDQKGTALLTFSHKDKSDDQWLYLPALKRVKRIASKNKSGPFMGSEFAFEDMTSQEVDRYKYKFLREEELNGKLCYVVERYPIEEESGYTKHVAWIDKDELRTWKVDFYDRKKSHLKTLTMSDYELYKDKFWRPHKMFMENLQTGKSTELTWSDFQFAVGLSDNDFTQNSLKRAR